jgi:hypothetical protein
MRNNRRRRPRPQEEVLEDAPAPGPKTAADRQHKLAEGIYEAGREALIARHPECSNRPHWAQVEDKWQGPYIALARNLDRDWDCKKRENK